MRRFPTVRSFLLPALPLFALACQEHAPRPPAGETESTASSSKVSAGRGRIEGRIRLSGPPPQLAPLPTSPSVVRVCGESVPDGSLSLGDRGALAHVVVSLANGARLPEPSPAPPPPLLDQKKCAFTPPVLAARVGSTLEVRNSDPLVHNVRALTGSEQPLLNVAMPLEGFSVRRPLPATPGIVDIRCDIHPWMRAVVRTFEHSYFTTTDATGHFRLEVPEGTHTVILWHPRLPGVTQAVAVRAGEATRLDHQWSAGALR